MAMAMEWSLRKRMTDALSATVKLEVIERAEERKLTIALAEYATRLSAASPRGAERGLTPLCLAGLFHQATHPHPQWRTSFGLGWNALGSPSASLYLSKRCPNRGTNFWSPRPTNHGPTLFLNRFPSPRRSPYSSSCARSLLFATKTRRMRFETTSYRFKTSGFRV